MALNNLINAVTVLQSYFLGKELTYYHLQRLGSSGGVVSEAYYITPPVFFNGSNIKEQKSKITALELSGNFLKITLKNGIYLDSYLNQTLNITEENEYS